MNDVLLFQLNQFVKNEVVNVDFRLIVVGSNVLINGQCFVVYLREVRFLMGLIRSQIIVLNPFVWDDAKMNGLINLHE